MSTRSAIVDVRIGPTPCGPNNMGLVRVALRNGRVYYTHMADYNNLTEEDARAAFEADRESGKLRHWHKL